MIAEGSVLLEGLGIVINDGQCDLYNRTGGALSRGALVELDLHQVAAETTGIDFHDASSVFANAVTPASATLSFGWYAVLLDASLADNAKGRFALWGKIQALVEDDADSLAVGDPLQPVDATGNLVGIASGAATAGAKIIARALEDVTTPTTAELATVLFNGVTGFGTFAAS